MMKFMILSLDKYQIICNRVSNGGILYFFMWLRTWGWVTRSWLDEAD